VSPPGDVRVPDPLFPDRESLFGVLEVDPHPARVLAVEEPVLIAPLGFQVEASEREPERVIRQRNRVDAPALRANGKQADVPAPDAPTPAGAGAESQEIQADERTRFALHANHGAVGPYRTVGRYYQTRENRRRCLFRPRLTVAMLQRTCDGLR
jgi:hypothetical protein